VQVFEYSYLRSRIVTHGDLGRQRTGQGFHSPGHQGKVAGCCPNPAHHGITFRGMRPPEWVEPFIANVEAPEQSASTVERKTGLDSDLVL
jgi:hypothetical protein